MFDTKYRLIVQYHYICNTSVNSGRYVYFIEKKLWWWPWWIIAFSPCFDDVGWRVLSFKTFEEAEEHGRKQLNYIANPYIVSVNRKKKQDQSLELPEEVEKWLLEE